MKLLADIKKLIITALQSQYPTIPTEITNMELFLNVDAQRAQFGDITTNVALIAAKIVGVAPRTLAQNLSAQLSHPSIARIEIAGPGFINFFLTQEAFQQLGRDLNSESFFKGVDHPLKYNIEFVSANPTGPLHFGHGRGGIIGDVLGNILRFIGHDVTKEFYINDAGVQIQKLGNSFKIRCLQQLGFQAELPEDGYHGEYLNTLAHECVLQHGDIIATKPDSFFTEHAKKHLLAQIKETLGKYGIQFDHWFSESTLHASGAIDDALQLLQKRGFLYEKEGALWFRSTDFGDDKDRVVKKQSGELTYVAADIAYLENKLRRHFDHLIMILGQDHHSYVSRLKAVLQGLGKNPELLDVILYQLVTLKEDGEQIRMSKRAGRIVTLSDIIDTVGKDVARFFYLNKKADAHLDFDLELALKQTDENPVYYIQYANVRIKSILAKAQETEVFKNISVEDAQYLSESERLLLKKIASLKELLLTMSKNYQIHALTYYAIELAQQFHSFYAAHKVLKQDQIELSRGRLYALTLLERTFKVVFDLLGISAPEKM